jgi:hypothetical protein
VEDRQLIDHINELVDEEHQLERAHIGKALTDEEQSRLDSVSVELDRCWDLLRQRRARRSAGLDPDDATARDAGVVEGYRQ